MSDLTHPIRNPRRFRTVALTSRGKALIAGVAAVAVVGGGRAAS